MLVNIFAVISCIIGSIMLGMTVYFVYAKSTNKLKEYDNDSLSAICMIGFMMFVFGVLVLAIAN